MQVKNTKREWKMPNAIETYKMRVKSTKHEWKIPNANEKYQTRVKNTKCEWKIPNGSKKYRTRLKNTRREWKLPNPTRHLYTSTNADLSVQSRGWLSVDPRHLGNSENRLANFLEGKILKKIKKHSWHENQWKDFQNFDHNYILMTFFLKIGQITEYELL